MPAATTAHRQPSTANRLPAPALRSVCEIRARWRDERTGTWHTADDRGIRSGLVEALRGEIEPLDFDTAISLSYAYLDRADRAEAAGDEETEYRWASWAEQLQLWAAKRVPAPGRVGASRASVIIRRTIHHDDQAVSFAALTRRD